MKKVILFFATMLAMSGSFISCSEDDEPKVLTEYEKELMLGTWDVTEAKGSPFTGVLKFIVYANTIEVYQNGSQVEEYTYYDKDGILQLTGWGEDGISATAEVLKITKTEAKLRMTDLLYGYGSYIVKLKKAEGQE